MPKKRRRRPLDLSPNEQVSREYWKRIQENTTIPNTDLVWVDCFFYGFYKPFSEYNDYENTVHKKLNLFDRCCKPKKSFYKKSF